MPSSAAHDTIARQWELLKLIPGHGDGASPGELCDRLKGAGYDVDVRTVQRDLQTLSGPFPFGPVDETRKPLRWRWHRGASVNIPGMSVAEALSLRLIEGTVRPLLPADVLEVLEPRWHQAKENLTSLGEANRHARARWVDKVRAVPASLPLLPPKMAPGVLETVQEALGEERRLLAKYQAAGDARAKELELHPLALVQVATITYLLATTFDYPDVRRYAVHRIRAAKMSSEPLKKPAGFDIDAYIAGGGFQFGTARELKLQARVQAPLVELLTETPLSADQKIVPAKEPWHMLTATVLDSWQLWWWLLGRGDQIVVVKPVALRRNLAQTLKAAAKQYAG
jgi:predicted DNA-binding transcriptional regulator YafY